MWMFRTCQAKLLFTVLLENDPRREITENISYIETRPGHADQVVQSPRFNGLKKKRV